MKKWISILILIAFMASAAWGAAPAKKTKAPAKKEEKKKYLTRAEMAAMLMATDAVAKKAGELVSWTVGYDITRVNRASQAPTINFIKLTPEKVPADGKTILIVEVGVEDPDGLAGIAAVRADLTQIGRLPNMTLVDNGLWGDATADDGIYTLQTTVATNIAPGAKEITVQVANKKGWMTVGRTSLTVENVPAVIEGPPGED